MLSDDLSKKSISVESVAQNALKDDQALSQLIENLKSKHNTIRENSFKALLLISEKHPGVLYPKWDFLVEMLDNEKLK